MRRPAHPFSYADCHPDAAMRGGWFLNEDGIQATHSVLPRLGSGEAPANCPEHHLLWNAAKEARTFSVRIDGYCDRSSVSVPAGQVLFVPAGCHWGWKLLQDVDAVSIRLSAGVLAEAGPAGL